MAKEDPRITREEQARAEVGQTQISPALAAFLVFAFLGVILAVPVVDQVLGRGHTGSVTGPDLSGLLPSAGDVSKAFSEKGLWNSFFALNAQLLRNMGSFESGLKQGSTVVEAVMPPVHRFMIGDMRAGNENAYCGRDGWLFYRPGVEYLTGPAFLDPTVLAKRARRGDETHEAPQPDPVAAIVQFRDQLAERGITLIVMPAPDKAALYPEKLSAHYDGTAMVHNPSYAEFERRLAEAKVTMCDVAPDLVALKNSGTATYHATDTHWTPEGMQAAAKTLAGCVNGQTGLPPCPPLVCSMKERTVENFGDITVMLKLPDGQTFYPKEKARLSAVYTAQGTPWQPDSKADVLFLGDSFANIYALGGMGWGENAGFVEHLSAALQRPVDAIRMNDNGAHATRRELSRLLARGEDRLAGKKLVVWEFAARELAVGDWRMDLPMTLGTAGPKTPVAAEGKVSARLVAIAPIPKPGTVPYKDCIVAVHLAGLPAGDGLAFLWAMRDNQLTPAAAFKPGDTVSLQLRPWADAEKEFGSYNRVELDDDALLSLPTYWAEIEGGTSVAPTVTTPTPVAPVTPAAPVVATTPWQKRLQETVQQLESQQKNVLRGQDNWLFFGPELRHLSVGPFWGASAPAVSHATNLEYADPLPAIVDFNAQLKAAGVTLYLVPVPPKASVYPGKLFAETQPGPEDQHLAAFYEALRQAGVQVVDLSPRFAEAGEPMYCLQDTHWNGAACALAGEMLAKQVNAGADFSAVPKHEYTTRAENVTIAGDLWKYLGDNSLPQESVALSLVEENSPAGPKNPEAWKESPVLLLGDSHCLIFHEGGDMYAKGAGLVDHLSKGLGFPVDLLGVRGSGATPARMNLLRRGDNLAGKKAVVWCFTAREFTEAPGGWRKLPVVKTSAPPTDRASEGQAPISAPNAPVAPAPLDDSLFRFSGALTSLRVLDEKGESIQGYALTPKGLAHYDHDGAMVLRGGYFEADNIGANMIESIKRANTFTLEVQLFIEQPEQERPMVISLGQNLFLAQYVNKLTLVFGTDAGTQKAELGTVEAGQRIHLLMAYGPEGFRAYKNGQVIESKGEVRGSLVGWKAGGLRFGEHPKEKRPWIGRMGEAALYARALTAEEAAAMYAASEARVAAHQPVSPLHVRAKLKTKSPVPTIEALAPYTENLTVMEYEVSEVLQGQYASKCLYVAHWGVLDSTLVPWTQSIQPGADVDLWIETLAENPQLASVNLADAVMTDFSLPLFYDAGDLALGMAVPLAGVAPVAPEPQAVATAGANGVAPSRYGAFSAKELEARKTRVANAVVSLQQQVAGQGGLEAWEQRLTPWRAALQEKYTDWNLPYIDCGGGIYSNLFEVNCLLAGTPYLIEKKNTRWHDARKTLESIQRFSRQLEALNMHLIFMPIPVQAEVFPERVSPGSSERFVFPQKMRLLQELAESGVEVVDLLPAFQAASADTSLYIPGDLHWSTGGIRIAAQQLAERVRDYEVVQERRQRAETYTLKTQSGGYYDAFFLSHAPEAFKKDYVEKISIPLDTVSDENGKKYSDYDNDSPILIVGDSSVGLLSPWGGGLSDHLAYELGIPVSRISKGAGGPVTPRLFASQPPEKMAARRIVIWTMISEYLFDQADQWSSPPVDLEPETSTDKTPEIRETPDNATPKSSAGPVPVELTPMGTAELARVQVLRDQLGGWDAWRETLRPFQELLRTRAGEQQRVNGKADVFMGADRFLFSIDRMKYLLTQGDTKAMEAAVNCFTQLSRDLAARGIHTLVVPVPSNEEVYPDKIVPNAPDIPVSPLRAEFVARLLENQVETLDLMPAFQEARKQGGALLCRENDPHWDTRGIQIAAKLMAERLRGWGCGGTVVYACRSETRKNQGGTLTSRLSEDDARVYADPDVSIEQVLDGAGVPYRAPESATVAILGDSYVDMYAKLGAGIGAHLAAALGEPVSEQSVGGGGPGLSQMLARKPQEFFQGRKAFVLCFVARYLEANNAKDWRPAVLPGPVVSAAIGGVEKKRQQ